MTEENIMEKLFVLCCMIFIHCYYDFKQGIVGELKQKSYWENHPDYKPLYRNDYIIALMVHGFIWSFLILLPVIVYTGFKVSTFYFLFLGINFMLHSIIDNEKANTKSINLVADQLFHTIQIILTWVVLVALR